ncbi:MAG TPA: PAS domain S-box protein [Bryobacteraceae bacterium]|nr:PAS domain S-box protein [Bryobacteraceae bacterium]
MALSVQPGYIKQFARAHYAIAVLAVAGAVGLRLALDPVIGAHAPYLPFVAAVLVAGRLGGRGPALAATVLSFISAWYFFLEPRYSFSLSQPNDAVGLGLFFVIAVAISLFETSGGLLSGKVAADRLERDYGDLFGASLLRRITMIAGGALALGILASLLWAAFQRSSDAERMVEHTYQVLNASSLVRTALERTVSSERGYLLSGEDQYTESYQAAVDSEQRARVMLRRLTADNRGQQAQLDEFDRLLQARLDTLASAMEVRRQHGMAAVPYLIRTTRGGKLMDQLRAILDAVDLEERRLLHIRSTAASAADSRMRWILGLGSGSLVLLLVLAAAAIERHIHERRTAEKVLARQARLIDLSHDAIITADGDRVITGWNVGAQKMYGFAEEEAVGRTLHELLRTGSSIPVADMNRVLALEGHWTGELVQTASDGRQIAVESHQVLQRDGSGQPSGYLEINRDITERRRAEEALRESRAELEAALASTTDAVFISDGEGRFVQFNEAFATFHRFRSKEECARTLAEYPNILEVFLPGGTPAPLEMWAVPRALRGEVATNAEYSLRRKDSGESWVGSYSFGPIRDPEGRIVGSVVVGRDVTERKRAEEALRSSEEKFAMAFAINPAAVAMTRLEDGRFVDVNESWQAMMGYSRDEAIGRTSTELHIWPAALDRASYVGELQEKGSLQEWEQTFFRKSGEPFAALLSAVILTISEETVILSTLLDISERRRAEDAVRKLNAELERRVRERTSELETMNKELEAFAYSVSHDLRAPLRGIDGWSLALIEDYYEKLDGKGRGYLDRVRSETQRMGQLIDDLLQLSRITRAEMHRDTVDLSRTAESIAARLHETHPQRRLEFVIRPKLTAFGDARMLEVALTNLLENAVKFTGPRAHARIEFETAERDGKPTFAVRDNGVGFDMTYSRTLFGPFQRLHSDSEFPGTGIGLATVQRVIHRHGGKIWAEAEPGRGATFYFTLGDEK